MKGVEKKYVLGIVTDEDAMFEILAKFLGKEGYEVIRLSQEIDPKEDFALIINASTRSSDRSKRMVENVKSRKLLIVQSGDEDYSETDDNTIVLTERPLNLKQLSDTIKKALAKSNYAGTIQ